MVGNELAAPQGFEPRYADPESAVLPLNEGATSKLFIMLVFRSNVCADRVMSVRRSAALRQHSSITAKRPSVAPPSVVFKARELRAKVVVIFAGFGLPQLLSLLSSDFPCG